MRWSIKTGADLGRVVSGTRRQRSMTQADLAERTGIDRTYIVRIESGATTIMFDRILDSLRALGLDLIAVEHTDG